MSTHKELAFEDHICAHLAQAGWLYAEGDAQRYDRELALYVPDLVAWFEATQPKVWEEAKQKQGEAAIFQRLRKQLNEQGTVRTLREGLEVIGVRRPLELAQFRPAMALNPEINARYEANRLRVVRQLRYSLHHQNCIDLVLFLNGLPVATCELKTDFTQRVEDAIDQYREDRLPIAPNKSIEPLLAFPGGAVVHFAVSDREVWMSTRLAGKDTRFLPFNRGDHGKAGNPINPTGHRSAYLWEEVWERASWLEIVGRYLIAVRDTKKKLKTVIFPRYHQLDVTRKLRAAILEEGAGERYLIQHSAGSGKTNSIAWAAHFLADLHDAQDQKIFATVLVVSDRSVIDAQLSEAIHSFERIKGVVQSITSQGGSKSKQLADALAANAKIVICTLQTFPHALKEAKALASHEGKRFAVIADEAHSSQTGATAAGLRTLLSDEELKALQDGGELSVEDILALNMSAKTAGITFVAFTATPKAKTLEMFGRRPHPKAPAGPDNLPLPFHVYSMQQAIQEGFILNVLENYTPYQLAYQLAIKGEELREEETVDQSAAKTRLVKWVKLHPYNIAQKVQVVVEHYRETVMPLLNGKAKAMVVLESRKEAVRWQLAVQKYIKEKGYPLGSLVAFSGEVEDPEIGPEVFSETNKTVNPTLKGDIREAFKGDEFHLLLVANKFQTGFDQPLLCGMYIDRRLAGVQAVQTLSRLNRAYPGKDRTYVLDFANSADDILGAFKTYYDTTELEAVTDPHQVLDLKAKLDAYGYYDEFEVEQVVKAAYGKNASHKALSAAIDSVAEPLLKAFNAAKEAEGAAKRQKDEGAAKVQREIQDTLLRFKAEMQSYQRIYAFLSQILDFGIPAVEARYVFYEYLIRALKFGRVHDSIDLSKVSLTHHKLSSLGPKEMALGQGDELKPMTEVGTGGGHDKQKGLLSEIVKKLNELFVGEISEQNKLSYLHFLTGTLVQNPDLIQQAQNNSVTHFESSPTLSEAFQGAVIDSDQSFNVMSRQVLSSSELQRELLRLMMGPGRLYELLREGAGAGA